MTNFKGIILKNSLKNTQRYSLVEAKFKFKIDYIYSFLLTLCFLSKINYLELAINMGV